MQLICNSIPKSGTYLLGAIAHFCKYQDSNLRFVDAGINVVDSNNNLVRFDATFAPKKLDALKDGQYAPSHLTYSSELEDFILSRGYRVLFIYRNPLDVLYSYVRFVTYSPHFAEQDKYNADLQNNFKTSFENDEERLCYVFKNTASNFNFRANLGWLQSKACHAVRFEELYADVVMLKSGKMGTVLTEIFDYVGFRDDPSPDTVYSRVYGAGPTFMNGDEKVCQFRRLDQAKLEPVLVDSELSDVMRKFHY